MQPLTRYLSLTLIPLLTFLAVAMVGQAWLHKETGRLQADAIAARRAQFVQALALTHQAPETWDASFQRKLGALLDGTVTLYPSGQELHGSPTPGGAGVPTEGDTGKTSVLQGTEPGQGPTAASEQLQRRDASTPLHAPEGALGFDYAFPDTAGLHARVTFAASATNRLIVLHQRMLAAVVLLALVLIAMSLLFSFHQRSAAETDAGAPRPEARSAMLGVEHFARISAERSEALKQESGARHRAEEDLQVSRSLLDQSMQARVQLGRNLHDNICQTLYAVSLSLEAVRRTISGGQPATAGPRLDQCIAELRRLNHEVRSYLKDLQPDAVQHMPFTEAIAVMLGSQSGTGVPTLVQDLEPEAIDLIAPEQTTEVLSILREAVSNSVRHGHAQTITLKARRSDESVILAVQDDGPGFDLAASSSQGHGLANMQARAAALGGSLKITSSTGKGTRILLTLPVVSEIQGESQA
jgi:signal transduction histidine kinase